MAWKVTGQGEDFWTSGSNGSEGSFQSFIEWTNTGTGARLIMEQSYHIYGDVTVVGTGDRIGDEPFFRDVDDNYAKAMLDYARAGALLGECPIRNYWLVPGQCDVTLEIDDEFSEPYELEGEGPELNLYYHGPAEQCEALDTAIHVALSRDRWTTINVATTDADLDEWLAATSEQ